MEIEKMKDLQGTRSSGANAQNILLPLIICLSLVLLTIIIFSPIKDCGFINFDDDIYLYENAHLQSWLNWKSIGHAFSFYFSNWHPLTWLSWMLDYSIFGLNPFGYHLVNLLLHIFNTVLLFLILWRMTGALWPSAFVAALFAIHPLHVESVAWISERKDVLSTFFWMLTLGAYSYYVEHREWKIYVLVILFFALGLMSKSMLVTLPFVLLLLDFWPLWRFSETRPSLQIPAAEIKQEVSAKKKKSRKKDAEKAAASIKASEIVKPAVPEFKWSLIYPLLLEKVPLFVLAILSSIVTYVAQQKGGAVRSVEALSPVDRIGNAFVSYIAYIFKMILPANLAVFYPHPGNVVWWQVLGAIVVLLAITFFVISRFKKSPYLASGWFWYLGTLVPVIGVVQVGAQAMADRYTYIPLIGLFIMVAWGIAEISQKWNYRREILVSLSALIIFILSILTWKQVGYWQNSITLYDHTLKVTENNALIHNNRGFAYYVLGDYRQAVADYSSAITIKPDYVTAYHNRGIAYGELGNYSQAIKDYNRVIEMKPAYAEAYYNRGLAYNGSGNYKQAIEDYTKAIAIRPDYAMAYNSRGNAYFDLGNQQEAIADYSRAIEMKPDDADAYFNRGNTCVHLGDYKRAISDYSRAIEIRQDYTGAYKNRGIAYIKSGNNDLAVNDFKTAAKSGDEQARNFLRSKGIHW
jgi:tetratricopeptide (TPR) repeat protein